MDAGADDDCIGLDCWKGDKEMLGVSKNDGIGLDCWIVDEEMLGFSDDDIIGLDSWIGHEGMLGVGQKLTVSVKVWGVTDNEEDEETSGTLMHLGSKNNNNNDNHKIYLKNKQIDFILCCFTICLSVLIQTIVSTSNNRPKVGKCGWQRSKVKTLLLQRSALPSFNVTDGQNTREQIARGRRSRHS